MLNRIEVASRSALNKGAKDKQEITAAQSISRELGKRELIGHQRERLHRHPSSTSDR